MDYPHPLCQPPSGSRSISNLLTIRALFPPTLQGLPGTTQRHLPLHLLLLREHLVGSIFLRPQLYLVAISLPKRTQLLQGPDLPFAFPLFRVGLDLLPLKWKTVTPERKILFRLNKEDELQVVAIVLVLAASEELSQCSQRLPVEQSIFTNDSEGIEDTTAEGEEIIDPSAVGDDNGREGNRGLETQRNLQSLNFLTTAVPFPETQFLATKPKLFFLGPRTDSGLQKQ